MFPTSRTRGRLCCCLLAQCRMQSWWTPRKWVPNVAKWPPHATIYREYWISSVTVAVFIKSWRHTCIWMERIVGSGSCWITYVSFVLFSYTFSRTRIYMLWSGCAAILLLYFHFQSLTNFSPIWHAIARFLYLFNGWKSHNISHLAAYEYMMISAFGDAVSLRLFAFFYFSHTVISICFMVFHSYFIFIFVFIF